MRYVCLAHKIHAAKYLNTYCIEYAVHDSLRKEPSE
jgi:hypothetical protein